MKRLSLRAAQRCENAKHKGCKCRCGGLLHGAGRGVDEPTDDAFYASLPKDDPHYAQPKGYRERKPKRPKTTPLFD